MGKYLWMAVTADEYELPLAVTDTARELAEIFGTTTNIVQSLEHGNYSGKKIGRRYVKVLNDGWKRQA